MVYGYSFDHFQYFLPVHNVLILYFIYITDWPVDKECLKMITKHVSVIKEYETRETVFRQIEITVQVKATRKTVSLC